MHRGLGEIRVTKEILVHEFPRVILVQKRHLEVVVLGLRVLKGTKGVPQHKDQKETPVIKVPRVIKMTLVLQVK